MYGRLPFSRSDCASTIAFKTVRPKMFFQVVLLISHFIMMDSTRAPTHLLVTRVGPCHEKQKTIAEVSEFSVTTQTYDSKLSGVIHISEGISNGWKIKATMQKCVDIRNIDTCDFFKSFFVVQNGCGVDGQNLYNTVFNFTTPKMKCPIQAGRYELRNYPYNSKDNYVSVYESKISTSVFGFTFSLDGYSPSNNTRDRKKIFCIETYLQLVYKRNHDWGKNIDYGMTTSPPTTQSIQPQTTVEDEDY